MSEIILMYLRKSRQDSDSESVEETLSRHEQILQEYAINHFGDTIPECYIFREVVSGETIAARPMIQKVLKLMEADTVKGVLVVDPQRLSRGDLVDCGTISNTFRYSETICYTPTMKYDMSVKHERKFFEAELMRGGEYLDYIKEILQRGRMLSVKNGNYIGSIAPYGYKKVLVGNSKADRHYTLEIVPSEAECIRVMYELYTSQNIGFAALANELDARGYKPRKSKHWSPAALKDMIENPVYIGKLRWNWRKTVKTIEDGNLIKTRPKSQEDEWLVVDGLHEGIVSEEIYNKAVARKGTNIRIKTKVKYRNPYSGLLYCQCGRAMSFRPHNNAADRLTCNGQSHCHTRGCTFEEFEDYIKTALQGCIAQFEIELKSQGKDNKSYDKRIKSLQKELKEIAAIEEEQYDLLETKVYTREIFKERNAKLNIRKEAVQASIDNLEREKNVRIDYEQKIKDFKSALISITSDDYSVQQKNAMIRKCIKKITYSRESGGRWNYTPFTCDLTLQV